MTVFVTGFLDVVMIVVVPAGRVNVMLGSPGGENVLKCGDLVGSDGKRVGSETGGGGCPRESRVDVETLASADEDQVGGQ